MNEQDARPRTIIALWKANMEEPNFNQNDPTVIISDISTSNFSTYLDQIYFLVLNIYIYMILSSCYLY